jgi:hypothetical protein
MRTDFSPLGSAARPKAIAQLSDKSSWAISDHGLTIYFVKEGGFWTRLFAKKSEIGSPSGHSDLQQLNRALSTKDTNTMPSIRVTVGAAIGCLFVCASFGGEGVAQTVSAQPVGKPMQLPQPTMHPGKSETKSPERSAAKRASKGHPAARKPASAQVASKDITNGTPQVTAPLSEPVIDGEALRVASPEQPNDVGLAVNAQGVPGSDASPAAATIVNRSGQRE